jgi:hypothetical protein
LSARKSVKTFALLTELVVGSTVGAVSTTALAQQPAPPKPAISQEAGSSVAQMGKSLLASEFSFQVRTLRVYSGADGVPLHIAHLMKITVRRPDRFRVDLSGDDGSTKMIYDGKTVVLFGVETKKYATIEVPNTIQGMITTLVGQRGVDFPLADLFTDEPDKSFLFGVSSGREINTVSIDGVPCRHLLFTQPPGIELELWVEKNDQALPRRLIITYRAQPGQPSFIAEMFDWNFSAHPTDSEFVFHAPEGSVSTGLVPANKPAMSGQKGNAR